MAVEQSLVSIVIPAFRADAFIRETLEHVSQQTYTAWELIVVEDASTGETETIVRDFATRHPGHRVEFRRHEKNQGPSASRNTAIQEARGKYIALLDADDLWMPAHLKASVQALETENCDLVYSRVVTFDSETGHLMGIWGPGKGERESFPQGLFHRNFITPSTVVLRREVFDQVGGFDPSPEIQACEDLEFWLRCVQANVTFLCIPGCHCMYRRGNPSAGSAQLDRMLVRQALVLEKHLGMPEIPLREQHYQLYRTYRQAGMSRIFADPAQATSLFWKAWRNFPRRVDCLVLAIFSGSIAAARKCLQKCGLSSKAKGLATS